MPEIKVSNLAIATTLSANDRVVVLANTSSSPVLKTATLANIRLLTPNTAPASNTSNGVAGQIAYDNSYVYVCVANNKWGRSALTLTW
jgi:hypothetical protein